MGVQDADAPRAPHTCASPVDVLGAELSPSRPPRAEPSQGGAAPSLAKVPKKCQKVALFAPSRRLRLAHLALDASLALALLATLKRFGKLGPLWQGFLRFVRSFPDHYQPVFDFVQKPMDPALAVSLWLADVYFLVKTYGLEGRVVARAHTKYAKQGTKAVVAVHGLGSVAELCLGLAAVLQPGSARLAQATALLALTVNVPTALLLNPRVFGVKSLTVPGFFKFAVLRTLEALRVLLVNHRLVPNLWILLHVGTMVRLLGYFVLPYSSSQRGDLFTDPAIYSFNILLSGYLTAAFVYPPKYLLGSLSVYMLGQLAYPKSGLRRRRLDETEGKV